MRELVVVMVVLAVWCEAAFAKPKVAILGLEVVVSGEKADPKDLQIAASLTESLREVARSGAGKFELAPNSDRELIDEKLAASCLTEALDCMAPLGQGLGADYLIYGNLVRVAETEKDGYQVSLKLLDVNARPPKLDESAETFVPASTLTGSPHSAKMWAQQTYAKLSGEPAPTAPRAEPEATRPAADAAPARTSEAKLQPKPATSSLTLGKGKLMIAGSTINLDISDYDLPFLPNDSVLLSFAPSVWYGITDDLTLGLTHDFGTLPWTPRPTFLTLFQTQDDEGRSSSLGAGLCVTVVEGIFGCPQSYKTSLYNSAGADVLYSLKRGRLSLVAHPGVDFSVRYPFVLSLRIAVLGRITVSDMLSLVFEPRLRSVVIGRCSGGLCDDFNQTNVTIPIWMWLDITRTLGIYLQTAFNRPIGGSTHDYAIPLQIGGSYKVSQKLTLGLDLGFQHVAEGDLSDRLAGRVLGLRVIYAP